MIMLIYANQANYKYHKNDDYASDNIIATGDPNNLFLPLSPLYVQILDH